MATAFMFYCYAFQNKKDMQEEPNQERKSPPNVDSNKLNKKSGSPISKSESPVQALNSEDIQKESVVLFNI